MNPCVELCWMRYGKQYSQECDTTCDFAKVVLENKALKQTIAEASLVVRCKDCRYSCISAWKYWCDNRNAPFYIGRSIQVEADDFCSYGKRRDNNA